jgi:hypothetical protein
MPLPKPRKRESRQEFVSRCMSDDMMTSEYKEQKQRVAVCLTQFQNIQKSKGEASWDDVRKGNILGLL